MNNFRLFTFIVVYILSYEYFIVYLFILLFGGQFPVLMVMNNAAVRH